MKRFFVFVAACAAVVGGCKTPNSSGQLKSEDAAAAPPQIPASPGAGEFSGPTRFFASGSGNYEVFLADGSVDFTRLSLPAATGDAVESSANQATCYQGQVTGLCAVVQKMVKRYNDAQDSTSDSTVWVEVKPESCKEDGGSLKFKWKATLSYDDSTTTGDAVVPACDMAKFAATAYLQRTEKGIPTYVPLTTEQGLVGGVDYFGFWAKSEQGSQAQTPNLDRVTCKADAAGAQVCVQRDGVQDYGGRLGAYCAQGSPAEIQAIVEKMIANSKNDTGYSGASDTLVTLQGVAPSKTGKTTIVTYTLGSPKAKFTVARSYALRPCAAAGTSAATSPQVTSLYFPYGKSDNGTYAVLVKGSKADGKLFGAGVSGLTKDMNCGDEGCKLKAVVKSKGCYRGSPQDVCPMVKELAENTDDSEHIFVGVDGENCAAGDNGKLLVGIRGMNDYANADEASSFSGTVELGPCQASQFAGETYVAERFDEREEVRYTPKTQSNGAYWLYSETLPSGKLGPDATYYNCDGKNVCRYKSKNYAPFVGACYAPGGDACKVMEQMKKNAATKLGVNVAMTCAMVGKQEKRLLTKWTFSGGKLTYKLKAGASIPMCGI